MEMKKRRGLLKNLSLKWSFVVYVLLCVIIALLISLLLSGLFSGLQNNLYTYYDELYREELASQGDIVVNGVIVQKDAMWFYTEDLHSKFSERDSFLYELYGALSVFVVPIISVICIFVTGLAFYRRKLKRPLSILDSAAARIASGDLDFHVIYESKNEFGRLADSFETMRASLHQANREMWRMIEQRKRLNAAFAHDLRTPLTVLRGYCDFLIKYLPDKKISPGKTLSTLSMMDVYITRLEGYTEIMSSLQKLEEVVPAAESVPFDALCEGFKNTAVALASGMEIDFSCHGGGEILVDTSIVFQVTENLVSNASRYACGKIKVSCRYNEGILTVMVSDDGPGFTQEALSKAAEPYYRDEMEKESPDTQHFGIGLYICRLLCEAHGGRLELGNDGGGKVTASFACTKK